MQQRRNKLKFKNETYEIWLSNFKKAFDIKTDTELCNLFGMTPSGISGYKRNNSFPFALVVEYCVEHEVSLDSIFSKKPYARQIKKNTSDANDNFDFKIINENLKILLPEINQNKEKSLSYFYQNKIVFLVDTNTKEVQKPGYYLLKNDSVFLVAYIEILFLNNFKLYLVNEDGIKSSDFVEITKDDLNKYMIVGDISRKIKLVDIG